MIQGDECIVFFPRAIENLPDFRKRIKAKHFHQYVRHLAMTGAKIENVFRFTGHCA